MPFLCIPMRCQTFAKEPERLGCGRYRMQSSRQIGGAGSLPESLPACRGPHLALVAGTTRPAAGFTACRRLGGGPVCPMVTMAAEFAQVYVNVCLGATGPNDKIPAVEGDGREWYARGGTLWSGVWRTGGARGSGPRAETSPPGPDPATRYGTAVNFAASSPSVKRREFDAVR